MSPLLFSYLAVTFNKAVFFHILSGKRIISSQSLFTAQHRSTLGKVNLDDSFICAFNGPNKSANTKEVLAIHSNAAARMLLFASSK